MSDQDKPLTEYTVEDHLRQIQKKVQPPKPDLPKVALSKATPHDHWRAIRKEVLIVPDAELEVDETDQDEEKVQVDTDLNPTPTNEEKTEDE